MTDRQPHLGFPLLAGWGLALITSSGDVQTFALSNEQAKEVYRRIAAEYGLPSDVPAEEVAQ